MAADTVLALGRYVKTRRGERAFGTHATLTIIECLHYLLDRSMDAENLGLEELQILQRRSLQQARECLNDLSHCQLDIASKVLRLLSAVIDNKKHDLFKTTIALGKDVSCTAPFDAAVGQPEADIENDEAAEVHSIYTMEGLDATDLAMALEQDMLPVLAEHALDNQIFSPNDLTFWDSHI